MKITNVEEKPTKTGGKFIQFTLEDGRKPSIFQGHSMWGLQVGDDIPDTLLTQNDKGYWNIIDPHKKPSAGRGDFAKAQQFKAESIQRAQKNKEDAIKLSSTFRDATLLTVAQCTPESGFHVEPESMKKTWLYWRSWLLQQYDNDDHTNSEPF